MLKQLVPFLDKKKLDLIHKEVKKEYEKKHEWDKAHEDELEKFLETLK